MILQNLNGSKYHEIREDSMRRVLALFVCAVVMICATNMWATEIDGPQWKSTTIINEGTNGAPYAATLVSATNIYPGRDQILGFSVVPHKATQETPTECIASLYDQTTTPITNGSGECLGEVESTTVNGTAALWYPYPQEVSNQVLVWQGPNTAVTIYFRR